MNVIIYVARWPEKRKVANGQNAKTTLQPKSLSYRAKLKRLDDLASVYLETKKWNWAKICNQDILKMDPRNKSALARAIKIEAKSRFHKRRKRGVAGRKNRDT